MWNDLHTKEKDFLSIGLSLRKSRIENTISTERRSKWLVLLGSVNCFCFFIAQLIEGFRVSEG